MAAIEEFESRLKEVVNAKRLSASRMEKLTELSMKLMKHDTQLVSILYRTHKSLPASAKIASLYVFDALCRAARSQVVKHNISGDIDAEKGNCATFLLKIDSVLDGLFQDVLSSGVPEAKEKTKKVLDIWTKSNTFPADVLARLGALGKTVAENSETGSSKEPKRPESAVAPTPVTDPRKQPTPPVATTTPPVASSTPPTAEAAQAALLALLTSGTGANNPSNVNQLLANAVRKQAAPVPRPQSQSQPHLEQLQLALLQQLSKNNNGIGASSFAGNPSQHQAPSALAYPIASTSQYPPRPHISTGNTSFASTNSVSPAERGTYAYPSQGSRDPRSSRFSDTQYSDNYSEQYSSEWNRGGQSRGFRGGFRGRGRGEFRGQYERDREPLPWDRGNSGRYENGPPPNRRRFDNRSQSPPPRRHNNQQAYNSPLPPSSTDRTEAAKGAPEPGKDEFGRDIRSGSVESNHDPENVRSPATDGKQGDRNFASSGADALDHQSSAQYDVIPTIDSKALNSNTVGLDKFDLSTFDPTNAESWHALGKAFQVTHGYVPSQEELMYLVMGNMGMMVGMDEGMNGGWGEANTAVGADDSTARSEITDRAGSQWEVSQLGGAVYTTNMGDHRSDAIVLGPDSGDQLTKETTNLTPLPVNSPMDSNAGNDPSTPNGKMQKVGDRWVFVRNTEQGGENQ